MYNRKFHVFLVKIDGDKSIMKSIFVGHVTDQFIAIHFVVSVKFKTPEEMFDQRKELVTFITKCDGIISNYDNFNIYYFFIKIVPRASWLGKLGEGSPGDKVACSWQCATRFITNCDRYYWNCNELTRANCDRGLQIATAPQILLPLFCGYSR